MAEGLARLEALLTQHMTSSAAESRERAREAEALRTQMVMLDGRITTLANKQLELENRQAHLERTHESTHGIALKARESHADLEGVVMRELSTMARAVATVQADSQKQNGILASQNVVLAEQNKALDEIRTGTSELVVAEKFRRQLADARTKWIEKWTRIGKFVLVVVGLAGPFAGLVWAVFQYATQHAR